MFGRDSPVSYTHLDVYKRQSQYDETVNDVYQKGYRMGGKVLRPAMVTVTYGCLLYTSRCV